MPPHTSVIINSTEIQPIEVRVLTVIVPPGTLIDHSTVVTAPVIVSVVSSELHTVMTVTYNHAVTCCPWIASNTQCVVGNWTIHRKISIMCILVAIFEVSKVNPQLCHRLSSCQTANLLQAQPMLSLHFTKPILIRCPSLVEVHQTVASSLEHGPAPSIAHVAPDGEGLPTPWVYGVHSQPSAAQDIGLLTVKGDRVQVAN